MKSILIIDAEPDSASALQTMLNRFGYRVDVGHTAEAVLSMVEKTSFDLLLMDLNIHSESSTHPDVAYGTGLIRQLRASQFKPPILTFTFFDGALYETASLDAGADDFILKTVETSRLLARLNCHIRRHERELGKKVSNNRRIGFGRYLLDLEQRILSIDETVVELTLRETQILELLAANPARTVSAKELLEHAWKRDLFSSGKALDGALKRLRSKLQKHEIRDMIENIKGRGYRLAL